MNVHIWPSGEWQAGRMWVTAEHAGVDLVRGEVTGYVSSRQVARGLKGWAKNY